MSVNEVTGVNEKDPSNSSLITMRPVASGDNVTTSLRSAQLKRVPGLVPCCEGTELQINEELIETGLSAISVKHSTVQECISLTHAVDGVDSRCTTGFGVVKHRNSFRSLHRPDLRRVPCLRTMAPRELESLFKGKTVTTSPPPPPPKSKKANQAIASPTESTSEPPEECVRVMLPTQDVLNNPSKKTHDESAVGPINGSSNETASALRSIPEAVTTEASSVLSTALPSGMQLHGARARLYTSVQATASAPPGDRVHGTSLAESEIDLDQDSAEGGSSDRSGELHIILPPRAEDQMLSDTSTISSDITP